MVIAGMRQGLWAIFFAAGQAATPLCADYVSSAGPAPALEVGRAFARIFTSREIKASNEFWAMAQDGRGIIYVANSDGILEYDGVRWRLIRTANGLPFFSLAADASGRIYAGALGDFGYLAPDEKGEMAFVSLMGKLPTPHGELMDVRRIHATPEGVFFLTPRLLLRFDGKVVATWSPQSKFINAFMADGRLIISEEKSGLLEWKKGSLTSLLERRDLPDKAVLSIVPWEGVARGRRKGFPGEVDDPASSQRAQAVSPDKAVSLLLGTESKGFFILEGRNLRPFPTEVDALLKQGGIESVLQLPDGSLLLATEHHHLMRISNAGRRLGWMENSDLQEQGLLGQDNQSGVWLMLKNGLCRAELPSPLSRFNEQSGLIGHVRDVCRHKGVLYVGTEHGLFRLARNAFGAVRFDLTPGAGGDVRQVCAWEDRLLLLTRRGILEIQNGRVERVVSDKRCYCMLPSRKYKGRLYCGLSDGLAVCRFEGGKWVDDGKVVAYSTIATGNFHEDSDGTLWAATQDNGVFRIDFSGERAEVKRFGLEEGLPSLLLNYVWPLNGGFRVATEKGIYRFSPEQQRFELDLAFNGLFPEGNRRTYILKEDVQGRVWINSSVSPLLGEECGAAIPKPGGGYLWDGKAGLRFSGDFMEGLLPEDDGVVWFGGSEGLIRMDTNIGRPYERAFPVYVRRVSAGPDRVLFGGTQSKDGPYFLSGGMELPYADNTLRFEFAALSFDNESANRYQVFLEGCDKGWSAWSVEPFKEYTNLPEGSYRLRVRAQNVYGAIGEEAVHVFRIRPPWFRTVWAYLLYGISLAGLVWGLFQWRMRRVSRERDELEAVVLLRTGELKKIQAIIKSLNEKHALDELLEAILGQARVFPCIEKASALVLDGSREVFRFRASLGWPMEELTDVLMTPEECHWRYVAGATPLGEDFFLVRRLEGRAGHGYFCRLGVPAAALVMRMHDEGKTEGYFVFENMSDENAFGAREIDLLNSLKEHFLSAFLKACSMLRLEESRRAADEARAVAEAAAKVKSEFLANMSHEIRTPINGVLGMLSLLLGTSMTEQQRHFARSAKLSGDILLALVNDILDLSKVEAGKLELEEVGFDLRCLLHEVMLVMGPRAEQKGLGFSCTVDPRVPAALNGDPVRLRQILLNLVGNALKFTSEGEVGISVVLDECRMEDFLLRFTVKDSGIGIPLEMQESIFQSFTQVDPSTTRKYGGTGLGLTISRQLAALMGGSIGVISEVGFGSEFYFIIPMKCCEASVAMPQEDVAFFTGDRNYKGQRVLLVEDNLINRDMALAIMDGWALSVESVCNGLEALHALRKERFALVLMDVQMPVMDGLEATSLLRDPIHGALDPKVPVVAMTAHAMLEDRRRCLEAGMDEYLTKPMEPASLKRVFDRFLLGRTVLDTPAEVAEEQFQPVFDQGGFLRRLMGNHEAAARITQVFRKETPRYLLGVQSALDAGDTHELARELHRLKGAAATLGGKALQAKSSMLEQAANAGKLTVVREELPGLRSEIQRLQAALESWEEVDVTA